MATYDPRDKYYRKARAKGLPSRAAFKIEELIGRIKLPPDARVIDLGCAPGGWLAILSSAVGVQGRVVGIDLAACGSIAPNVITIAGDFRDPMVAGTALERLGGPAALVTSDLAPKLTGIRARDEAGMSELLEASLAIAAGVLQPGGALIAKIFMSAEFKAIVANFEQYFNHVEVTRTEASRPGSGELYIIARDFRSGRRSRRSQATNGGEVG